MIPVGYKEQNSSIKFTIMRYKNYFLLLLLIVHSINSFAQYTLSGKVSDKKDNTYLSGANIVIKEINKATISDNTGNFIFKNIPKGKYTLTVSFVGYKSFSKIINLNKNINLDIKLYCDEKKLQQVTVLANRIESEVKNIPAQIDIINKQHYQSTPVQNVDDVLQTIPGVYVNRSWGIFSKNSSVTMRGLDGTSRVLVLYNGVPLNKTAGGGINWHVINTEDINKIEVQKGPASALYGNNAMTGVINIETNQPSDKLNAYIAGNYGEYNTLGGRFGLSQNLRDNNSEKGFYYGINGFYRQGDGYNIIPADMRDFTDVPLYLQEYQAKALMGYSFNDDSNIETEYTFYKDKRGDGRQVYEENGGYMSYQVNYLRTSYKDKIKDIPININFFYHNQYYLQHSERLNQTGDTYKLYDRIQDATDAGIWMNATKNINKNHVLTFGFDGKTGKVTSEEIYRTSTDHLFSRGKVLFGAGFMQHQYNFNNISILTGIRLDAGAFSNGALSVNDPTSVTAFESNVDSLYPESSWLHFSPKVAFKYHFTDDISVYASYSHGFMPPKLDDMITSRKISKGFKVANPELKPEKLDNFEIGYSWLISNNLKLSSALYYSIGTDFHYFVGTGDTVDVDRAVLRRINISEVNVSGTEIALDWKMNSYFKFNANYTYNNSVIAKFDLDNYWGEDLSSNLISETPTHQAFAGVFFNAVNWKSSILANYIGEMWSDEQNIQLLDDYLVVDFRLQYELPIANIILTADVQNIFDVIYIDKKGGLCPGRFYMLELKYNFKI